MATIPQSTGCNQISLSLNLSVGLEPESLACTLQWILFLGAFCLSLAPCLPQTLSGPLQPRGALRQQERDGTAHLLPPSALSPAGGWSMGLGHLCWLSFSDQSRPLTLSQKQGYRGPRFLGDHISKRWLPVLEEDIPEL